MDESDCVCCGVPKGAEMAEIGSSVCPYCAFCTGRGCHGDVLQEKLTKAVFMGHMDMWVAIANMATDDAHMTGTLSIEGEFECDEFGRAVADPDTAKLSINRSPRRWEVVVYRATARCQRVEWEDVFEAMTAPFDGCRDSPQVRDRLRSEVIEAISLLDPLVSSVEVEFAPVPDGSSGIEISVRTKGAKQKGDVTMLCAEEDIPSYVMSRPHASA